MDKILADDEECTDKAHIHEDVRETSMLFKENNYGTKRWETDAPLSGFANLMPFWISHVSYIQDDHLSQVPKVKEIERFISNIMNAFKLSNEVCLMSLIFIERLL